MPNQILEQYIKSLLQEDCTCDIAGSRFHFDELYEILEVRELKPNTEFLWDYEDPVAADGSSPMENEYLNWTAVLKYKEDESIMYVLGTKNTHYFAESKRDEYGEDPLEDCETVAEYMSRN